jgi:hypothetical protein
MTQELEHELRNIINTVATALELRAHYRDVLIDVDRRLRAALVKFGG